MKKRINNKSLKDIVSLIQKKMKECCRMIRKKKMSLKTRRN